MAGYDATCSTTIDIRSNIILICSCLESGSPEKLLRDLARLDLKSEGYPVRVSILLSLPCHLRPGVITSRRRWSHFEVIEQLSSGNFDMGLKTFTITW